jgi:hypothetical protein
VILEPVNVYPVHILPSVALDYLQDNPDGRYQSHQAGDERPGERENALCQFVFLRFAHEIAETVERMLFFLRRAHALPLFLAQFDTQQSVAVRHRLMSFRLCDAADLGIALRGDVHDDVAVKDSPHLTTISP